MWDLGPTRDQTWASCIRSRESQPLDHQGSPFLELWISYPLYSLSIPPIQMTHSTWWLKTTHIYDLAVSVHESLGMLPWVVLIQGTPSCGYKVGLGPLSPEGLTEDTERGSASNLIRVAVCQGLQFPTWVSPQASGGVLKSWLPPGQQGPRESKAGPYLFMNEPQKSHTTLSATFCWLDSLNTIHVQEENLFLPFERKGVKEFVEIC